MNVYPNNPLNLGNGMSNPYLTQMPIQQPVQIPAYQPVQMPGPRMEVQRVNGGRESANAYNLGANSSTILVDNNLPKIWFVSTDSSCYKAVNGFWVIPDNGSDEIPEALKQLLEPTQKTATDEEEDRWEKLNERLDKLEERIERYGKPDRKPYGQGKPGNAGNAGSSGNDARSTESSGIIAANGG